MYGQHKLVDAKRIFRAILSNQVARLFPRAYVRLTSQTGRGSGPESVHEVVQYVQSCFLDYFRVLQIPTDGLGRYLAGRTVLEYGPGDVPGVGLLMYAHGADRVFCVDRFPLVSMSPKNQEILRRLIERLDVPARERAEHMFNKRADPASGLRKECLEYLVRPDGVSGITQQVDLVISRAVLEHVNNLFGTFTDMQTALRPGGIAVHLVDLKSHGLHQTNPLDFLTWPQSIWKLMYGYKGVPNRLRIDQYRTATEAAGLRMQLLMPTLLAEKKDIDEVRPHLAAPFQNLKDDDLSCLGFWLILSKPAIFSQR